MRLCPELESQGLSGQTEQCLTVFSYFLRPHLQAPTRWCQRSTKLPEAWVLKGSETLTHPLFPVDAARKCGYPCTVRPYLQDSAHSGNLVDNSSFISIPHRQATKGDSFARDRETKDALYA